MLTKNQFAKKNATLSPVERSAAWKSYLAENGVQHGKLTGESLVAQKSASAAGVARSNRQCQLADRRIDQFDANVAEIDRILAAAGFALRNVSECDSRYYERDGQHVRVSDHAPNAATAAWMESVGCVAVVSVCDAMNLI